ncbi:uncharacterized protein B0T15DRAFT_392453 [Chaetomium strumarium]|uniref:UBC core domain-containing protein n=1 Tax=Chaetomium strumarium TaxID=1170767 RepID=A0AAJ0GYA7_9PEZI|nr:hypothetical protein B0T15DRAFT_392453 [Chaetomium strumarium]
MDELLHPERVRQPKCQPNDEQLLAEYRESLQSLRCVNCSAAFKLTDTELIQRTKKMLGKSCFLHPCLQCRKCKGWSCVGGDTYHAGANIPVLRHVASGKGIKFNWCCDRGRLFLIFSILCGFSAIPKPPPVKRDLRPRPQSSGAVAHSGLSEEERSPALAKGTGYGSSVYDQLANRPNQVRQGGTDDVAPELMEQYFLALSSLLPSPTKVAASSATAFDCRSQPLISQMIRRSAMLDHASELLRYAAIEEINTWCGPTTAVLDFMETMGSHFDFIPILLRERTIFPPEDQLIQVVLGKNETQGTATRTVYESAQSLAAIVEELGVPCRKFLEGIRRYAKLIEQQPKQERESVALATQVAVAQRISDLADSVASHRLQMKSMMDDQLTCPASDSLRRGWALHTSEHVVNAKATHSQAQVATAPQESAMTFRKWHRENCVKDLPDHVILEGHAFKEKAGKLVKSNHSVGRMRKLVGQISSLSTDLPEGIYVRHGESRLDVLRILISGPADTPYENGLFEFDMFCDQEFPEEPPRMRFRTTGGGQAHFNPNLYNNGKICLSLLGTWTGQPWEPGRSTILQILVSIQSMIFNSQPYYNEPGYEQYQNDDRSKKYNRNVEQLTVRYALLPWLTQRLANQRRSSKADTSTASGPSSTPQVQGPVPANLDHANVPPLQPLAPSIYPYQDTNEAAPLSGVGLLLPPPPAMIEQQSETPEEPHSALSVMTGLAMLPCCARFTQGAPAPPKHDDPVWGDVIRKHFETKSSWIMERVRQWEKMADEYKRYPEARCADAGRLQIELAKQLKEHGFRT